MSNIPQALIIHHEGAQNGLLAVNRWHQTGRKFPMSSLGWYIGYQYYIELDGSITQTRADTEEGMHTLGGWNRKSIGICLQGHFGYSFPRDEQLLSLERLMDELQVKYDITNSRLFLHNELWPKVCPGKNLAVWLKSYRENDITYLQIKLNQLKALIAELISKLSK